jgi:pimeloyl-ACP methyl ester carboxylesterase
MSDWDVADISIDAWANDIASVVDAAGLDRFPLLGISQGCAVSVTYALRHPERVSHLILFGGFALGAAKRSAEDAEKRKALLTLMRMEWGNDNSVIRQLFANYLMPGATKAQADTFNDLQRKTTSPEYACRYFEATGNFDVTALLPQLRVPTLVMHARGDRQVPFEAGRQLAAGIPGAKFVALQGDNHLPLEQDPATQRFFEEMELFLGH